MPQHRARRRRIYQCARRRRVCGQGSSAIIDKVEGRLPLLGLQARREPGVTAPSEDSSPSPTLSPLLCLPSTRYGSEGERGSAWARDRNLRRGVRLSVGVYFPLRIIVVLFVTILFFWCTTSDNTVLKCSFGFKKHIHFQTHLYLYSWSRNTEPGTFGARDHSLEYDPGISPEHHVL